MSDIQIYYLIPEQLKKSLQKMNIDLSIILREGDKTIAQVSNEINSSRNFCRDEFGIDFKHLKSLIFSDISLYASLDSKIAGLLTFMFTENDDKKYIIFDGLCSPIEYTGKGIGQELINTLIRIGKAFNIDYINLECKGDLLVNYYKKFGFTVTSSKISYDSDDSDDEDNNDLYYNMQLDLSKISGGNKRKRKSLKKKTKRVKRKSTRKLRKYH
jgi:hypothetical protein